MEHFRPGINSATDGLSTEATQAIMDKLKDLLDGKDPETGIQETPPVQVQVLHESGRKQSVTLHRCLGSSRGLLLQGVQWPLLRGWLAAITITRGSARCAEVPASRLIEAILGTDLQCCCMKVDVKL